MRVAVRQVVLALLTAACGLAFAPAFGGRLTSGNIAPGGILAAVAVGALAPALVVGVARLCRLEALVAALLGLLVSVLAIVLVTRPGTHVLSGAYRLLTSALPAEADGPARGTVAGLTAICGLTAAMLAAYSRAVSLAVLPPFVALVAALSLDAGVAEPPTWYAAPVVVLLGFALAVLRPPVGNVHRLRALFPVAGAALVLAAGAALAVAVVHRVPAVARQAADARDLVAAPLTPRTAINPMLEYPALARGVSHVSLSGTSSRRVDRLTYVTLTDFDGRTWSTAAHFRRAARSLSDAAPGTPVRVDIAVHDAGPLAWLVRPDRPTSVDQGGLGVNESTDDLVVPAGSAYPAHYHVSGSAPVLATVALRDERAVHFASAVSTGTTPVPKSIKAFAQRAASADTDYLELIDLQQQFRGSGFYVEKGTDAPSGNGYFQIAALIAAEGKHIGTSEQYASAFTVMARLLGFDARLVLGFQPHYGHGNAFTITGKDVHAWAQVQFAHAGWVTFDPTPTQTSQDQRSQPHPAPGGAAGSGSSSHAPSSTSSSGPSGSATSSHRAAPSALSGGIGLWLVVALLVLVVLVTPPGAKLLQRRRRRGAPVAAHAVYGAWRETNDRLGELGAPPPRGRSTRAVVVGAPAAVRSDVAALGAILDRAGYAPEDAQSADARTAWAHADTATRTLRAGVPWWRRPLTWLDPRPLWRR